jgi:4-hydroxy-tetrahydrodipicolinate synthase
MSKAKRGVYAAAITPIGADGEPDLEKLIHYCRELLTAGCDGIAPLGTTGEAAALPFTFRQRVPGALARAGIAADAVIMGVGSSSIGDAIAISRASLAAGFCNLLVLPPYYTKDPSDDGLYDYYSRLIETVGDDRLRLYLYHIPQVTMVSISHALVGRLRSQFGGVIAGIKDSSGSFESAESYVGSDNFDVYPSSEATLTEGLAAGCAGVISGSTNVCAALARKVLHAPTNERDALQAKLTDFRKTIQGFPLIPAVKQIQAWRSKDEGWLRMLPPLRGLSAEQAVSLKRQMIRLEQIEGVLDAA